MAAMDARPLLIVSSHLTAEALCQPPFRLDPEAFLLTSLESVQWLGFSRFAAVILHEPPLDLLRKLALGLRDSPALEALWDLLKDPGGPPIRGLIPAPSRPPQHWLDLGLEPILPQEIAGLFPSPTAPGRAQPPTDPRLALTADDVRELHQQGVRVLPIGQPLTDWAREVASALGLTEAGSITGPLLYRVRAVTRRDLQAAGERLFQAARSHPDLWFVLVPPLIPLFQELYPALKNRVVASTVHWASHGAFTGETSVAMLTDLGCRGAILPPTAPHTDAGHLKALADLAGRRGLSIFTTLPLERLSGCDIMAPHPGSQRSQPVFVPLATPDVRGPSDTARPPTARLVDDQELDRLVQRKG